MRQGLLLLLLALPAAVSGQVVKSVCSASCDYGLNQIQQAVNDAEPGTIIEIQAGQTATTANGLVLRYKGVNASAQYITIRSTGARSLNDGYRVQPTDAPNLAGLTATTSASAIMTVEQGASYYWFEGVEFAVTTPGFVFNMIQLSTIDATGGVAEHEAAQLVHDLVFDRCYFHGIPGQDGPRRAIMANSGRLTITNSWFENIKSFTTDSAVIGGWNATGPFYFRNNHFSTNSITTIFGGAVPNIQGIRATGIEFYGNHYYKPWAWRSTEGTTDPGGVCLYDQNGGEYYHNTTTQTYWRCVSGSWTSIPLVQWSPGLPDKNHFELKNASQALVEGNLFENGWLPAAQSQRGAAFAFNQVDNSDGVGDPSSLIEYVTIRYNKTVHTPWAVSNGILYSGLYFNLAHDNVWEHNLFDKLGAEPESQGNATIYQTTNMGRTRFSNNTATMNRSSGGIALAMDAGPALHQEFYGNILGFQEIGFRDGVIGYGNLWNAFDGAWSSDRAFSKNVVVNNQHLVRYGRPAPVNNLMIPSDNTGLVTCSSCASVEYFENGGNNDVGFMDWTGGNFRLKPSSPYKGWSHLGEDAGADMDLVDWSTAHAADGAPNPFFDFRVRDVDPSSSSLGFRYTAYDESACTLMASINPDYSNPVTMTDTGGDRDRLLTLAGLTADTRYFYRLTCGSGYKRYGFTLTRP